jgi:hypothetical protein
MRLLFAVLAVAASLTPEIAAFQARADAPKVSACALLTPDLALKFNNKETFKYLTPEEAPMGNATRCEYGRIGLVVYPPKSGPARQAPSKDAEPLPGVGQMAFFYNRRNTYAELSVWTSTHFFGIQLGKRTGATMDATKAEAIELAKAIVPKLN